MSKKMGKSAVAEPKKRNRFLPVAVVCALLALLAVGYFAMVQYYSDRFPMRTEINSLDVSNLSANSVKRMLNQKAQEYTLTIRERDGVVETVSAQDIDLAYEDNGDIDELLSSYNPYKWPLYLLSKDELSAANDTTYDEEKLDTVLSELNCFNPLYITKLSDACLIMTDDGLSVQNEVEGTELDQDAAVARMKKAISGSEAEIDLDGEGLYLEPKIRSDDEALLAEKEKLDVWLSSVITFDFEDDRVYTVDQDVIYSWLVCGDDGTYSMDEEAVTEWVKTQLAYQTDTFGLTHEFTTHSGKVISLSGGDYGWCIARGDTAKKIIEAVKEGKQETMEPEYQYTANFRGVNDIGDKYIEINLSEQKMYCYKDGKLIVETDVVTGCVAKGTETPSGSVWAVDCHKSPAVLGTLDTMGYSSPVTYWMSFTGNVGLHDADGWRSAYGGNIYLTNGSHGCVNTPKPAMSKIYDNFNVGDPVIVYK